MPSWIPRQRSIQDQLVEEIAKQEAIRFVQQAQRNEPAAWTPLPETGMNIPEKGIMAAPQLKTTPRFDPAISVRPTPEITPMRFPELTPIQQEIASYMPEEFRAQAQPTVARVPSVQGVSAPSTTTAPATPTATTLPAPAVETKNLFQSLMGGVGKAFEWVKETLERPWASIVTAPWSPSLPYLHGEGVIAHEKREYDAWKAPKFVKGLTEATMPLYWLPYFGWMAKGARTLGLSSKVVRSLGKAHDVLELPTDEFLNKSLYGSDFGRKTAIWAEHKPVLNLIVKAVGGEASFIKEVPVTQKDIVARAVINRGFIREMAGNIQQQWIPRLTVLGDEKKILDIAADGIVGVAIPKTVARVVPKLDDVLKKLQQEGFDIGVNPNKTYTHIQTPSNSIIIGTKGKSDIKNIADALHEAGHKVRLEEGTFLSQIKKEKVRDELDAWEWAIENASKYGVSKKDIIDSIPESYIGKLNTEELGVITKFKELAKREELPQKSRYLYDVLENSTDYTFTTPQARKFINEFHSIQNELKRLKIENGMEVKGDIAVHRLVSGKTTELGYEASEFGSRFEVQRMHKTQAAGVAVGVDYKNSAVESLASTIRYTVNGIAKKRFNDAVKDVGVTARQLFENTFSEKAAQIVKLRGQQDAYRYGTVSLQKVISSGGERIPGATLKKLREDYPELAQRIDDLWKLRPSDVDKVLLNMSAEIRRVMKIKPRDFKIMLNTGMVTKRGLYGDTRSILMSDIEDVIRHMNISDDAAARAIERGYRQVYRLNKDRFKDGLKTLRDEAKTQLTSTKEELRGLLVERRDFEKHYKEYGQILGTGKYLLPQFGGRKNMIVPDEVAKFMKRVDGDKGNQWVRNVGKISETSRLATATLDMSAGFIQGLNVLGRDPIGWGKATAKSFEFLANPKKFIQYMASPEIQSLHNEMVKYGARIASSEFTEGGALLTRALGKVPKVGTGLQKLEEQTIGRSIAAFLGWRQVAVDNLYKSMRYGKSPEELQQLVRSLDRMTGVMSTAAIGIGKSQREVENAFLFFAPSYTRASMAFIGDVFKGGIAGQNSRQALGGLMLGGTAFYYGAAKALGQEPNFDPTSGKFMTVKIGEQRVGLGGMMYSLARLGGNLATVENPTDLLRVDRVDNPFVTFMYGKSAPLTGIATGLFLEHKDYLGMPFETPADWGRFIADKVTPISVQAIMPWSAEKTNPTVFALAGMGGRTFPVSPSEIRNDARNRYAQQDFGADYADLPKIEQKRIDANEDIQKLTDEVDKRTLQIGNKLGVAFVDWKKEREDARFVYEDNLNNYQRAFDNGLLTSNDFKELMVTEGQRMGATYEHINNLPRYKEVMEKLSNKKSIDSAYLEDIAYQELVSNTQQFEDEYGIFNYDAYNRFKDSLRTKYGEGVWQKVMEIKAESDKNLPPLAREYKKAQEIMKPYWEIQDRVERLFGKRFAESPRGKAMISKQKKLMRATRPDIAKYYQLFYANQ